MEIHNTKNPEWLKLKLAILGRAGSGKTFSMKTLKNAEFMGKKRVPLIIDCDGGMLTLAREDIDFVACKSWDPFTYDVELIEGKEKRIYPETDLCGIMRYLQTEEVAKEYNVIVFDLLTRVQQMLIARVGDHIEDTYAKWGRILEDCNRLQDVCYNKIPHDIIWMCEVTLKDDEMSGATLMRPNLSGAWGKQFNHIPDELYFAERRISGDDFKYIWVTMPDARRDAKSRIRADTGLLPEIIPQDFVQLYEIIEQRFNLKEEDK